MDRNFCAVAFLTIKPEKPYEFAFQVLERLDFDLGLSCVFVSRTFCSRTLLLRKPDNNRVLKQENKISSVQDEFVCCSCMMMTNQKKRGALRSRGEQCGSVYFSCTWIGTLSLDCGNLLTLKSRDID